VAALVTPRKGDSVMVVSGSDAGLHGRVTSVPPDHHLILTSTGELAIVWDRHLHPYNEREREEFPPHVLAAMRAKAQGRS
jgi:ribosomal protein L24